MKQENVFRYVKSQHLEQVTLLQAEMNDFAYGKHAHDEYSFGVTLAGRQDFFSNGEFHRSKPGNIMVFNPGEVHDGSSGIDTTLQYRMLYIHPDQLIPMLATAGIKNPRDFQVTETLIDDPLLRRSILQLSSLIELPEHAKLQQECEFFQMASRIAQRHGANASDHKEQRRDRLLNLARDYIQDNLPAEMSLDQISAAANLSKYHFLRLFKQQFGITPHQYIINCRINRAREALDQGLSIDDAAFKYGFTDLSHFNRRFKPIYGMTPKQYQRLVLNS
jgi:AraC-like DNA-binding protein